MKKFARICLSEHFHCANGFELKRNSITNQANTLFETKTKRTFKYPTLFYTTCLYTHKMNLNREEDNEDEEESLSEALLAVASAEEYAAKIIKLQQACLTPLKEDLADWLNKIMNISIITTDNFMDKLDNGVIICRLAKIISLWCEQQQPLISSKATIQNPILDTNTIHQNFNISLRPTNVSQQPHSHNHLSQHHNNHNFTTTSSQLKLNCSNNLANHATSLSTSNNPSSNYSPKFSLSNLNITDRDIITDLEIDDPYRSSNNKNAIDSALATPLRHAQPRLIAFVNGNGPSKLSSQSTNCLIGSSSTTSLNNGYSTGNQFLNNLIRMNQTKIWEDAKCRTFYARDNVSNFIRWSKEFGVNQSVLFESDDLVLHANPRQVVLCLLDVARIACVKHGFIEAPGLVKFEQEIDRELAAEKAETINQYAFSSRDDSLEQPIQRGGKQTIGTPNYKKHSSLIKNSRAGSISDATDELIMRYCLHKEEEAARKKAMAAELEAAKLKTETNEVVSQIAPDYLSTTKSKEDCANNVANTSTKVDRTILIEANSLIVTGDRDVKEAEQTLTKSPSGDSTTNKNNLNYDNRVDSLDSGEGRTESASTSYSRTPVNLPSAIPVPIKRSNSSSSLTSNSMGTSELSSSRSSLLSGQESTSAKRHIASDLDGKVMRIAKSYYGKGATKGVTRLSEGKYKIADRIVFVRLLKGHRVMVRIGGGWDTLENFLFRHKSDPSQVIDVDNLLPIETKMTFERSPQQTPTNNKFSKLPYYRRSSSASSTNLSVSNLSVYNNSPTSSSTTYNKNSLINTPVQQVANKQQIPYLLIHRGQDSNIPAQNEVASSISHPKQLISQRKTISNLNKYNNRLIGGSRTPTASSSNLYPATLTTRLASTSVKNIGNATNIHNVKIPKQGFLRKLGRSNDSLQTAYYKSPQNRQYLNNGLTSSSKRKIDAHKRPSNGFTKQTNSINRL